MMESADIALTISLANSFVLILLAVGWLVLARHTKL